MTTRDEIWQQIDTMDPAKRNALISELNAKLDAAKEKMGDDYNTVEAMEEESEFSHVLLHWMDEHDDAFGKGTA